MRNKPPLPLCKAFLVLSQIVDGPNGEVALVGLPRRFPKSAFPAATQVAFFARLTSAHGHYQVEVQLQTPDGQTVWREGPPNPWPLDDPLELYDLKLNMCASFPKPGRYDFVLLMNGDEIARQPFPAELAPYAEARRSTPGDSDEE
jgi:hypothetical protein